MSSELSDVLKRAIQASAMTLNEIERRCGVSHAVLSRFMRGERTLTLPLAEKLCLLFGLKLVGDGTPLAPAPGKAVDTQPSEEKPKRPRGRPRKTPAPEPEQHGEVEKPKKGRKRKQQDG